MQRPKEDAGTGNTRMERRSRGGVQVPISTGPVRDLRKDASHPACTVGGVGARWVHPHLAHDAGRLLEAAIPKGAAARCVTLHAANAPAGNQHG
eukprot:1407160-Pyramimonas_sp.AAC.1